MSNMQKLIMGFVILIIIVVSFLGGIFIGQAYSPKNDLWINRIDSTTFYATIEEIKEYNGVTRVFVKGLDINDINYRGEYYFSIKENTAITWRTENITISDLNVGDNISITFTDETILTIYPTPLNEVIKINLLDDEI